MSCLNILVVACLLVSLSLVASLPLNAEGEKPEKGYDGIGSDKKRDVRNGELNDRRNLSSGGASVSEISKRGRPRGAPFFIGKRDHSVRRDPGSDVQAE